MESLFNSLEIVLDRMDDTTGAPSSDALKPVNSTCSFAGFVIRVVWELDQSALRGALGG